MLINSTNINAKKLRDQFLRKPNIFIFDPNANFLIFAQNLIYGDLRFVRKKKPYGAFYFAEGMRFELMRGFPLLAFQASALDHYANPPNGIKLCSYYSRKKVFLHVRQPDWGCTPVRNVWKLRFGLI